MFYYYLIVFWQCGQTRVGEPMGVRATARAELATLTGYHDGRLSSTTEGAATSTATTRRRASPARSTSTTTTTVRRRGTAKPERLVDRSVVRTAFFLLPLITRLQKVN